MTRFCGNCGTGLDAAALASGHCPTCGVPISTAGDPLMAREAAPKRDPDIFPFGAPSPAQERAPAPWWPGGSEGRRGGGTSVAWVIGAVAVAAVLLFGLLAYVLAQRGGTTSSSPPVGSSSPTSALASATATAPDATATPTQEAPTPTLTPTATPIPADLSVQPTKFSLLTCPTQVQFTIANTGVASLTWTATSSTSDFTLDKTSGALNSGDQVTVTVTVNGFVGSTGTITITAPGALHSPQTVTITCTI